MPERFWAKTGDGRFREDGSPKYHPVICHLADTAAVAKVIVQNCLSPLTITTLERGLGLSGESLVKCCSFLAGSHDLGKISPAFQFQVDEIGRVLAGGELYDLWHELPSARRNPRDAPHGLVTARTLPEFLVEVGLDKRLAKKLAAIVGGHHGFFPSFHEIKELDEAIAGVAEGNVWWRYSQEIFEQLRKFVGLESQDLPQRCDDSAAMILAGLTTVSDWIASNPDPKTGFPYANDDISFEDYIDRLAGKAQRALEAIGWTKLPTGHTLNFSELFPEIAEPRELQKCASAVATDLTAPCLVLIEASMGEGKTEAALYLADHLQHQQSAGGFYVGLPTQATSNAMWERVRKFLGQRYPEQIVNLTLSHSAAALKEEYQQTICRLDQVYDEEGKVRAGEWHTARKRTLLSPYGVGTLDQALMGAVRSRHQFVRLFGLAGRVVILDEIHAYDLYTGTLLERFLEWLALLGSPVIALSATLPLETRRRLVTAYAKGCSGVEPEIPTAEYPRLSLYTPEKLEVRSFPASPHVQRSLNLHWVNDEEWPQVLQEKLAEGGCATVICSTVGRAQEVFQRLEDSKCFGVDELGLFHGRFLFYDRDRIEKDCLVKFGKPNDPKTDRPPRYVLVATQVIEQSLDLDFDLMISDLAPIDLLLQRSGRLHRHAERKVRPPGLTEPAMWVVAPSFDETGQAGFAQSEFIYDRHVLLRSWLATRHHRNLNLPQMMDSLIEFVYDLSLECPSDLESIHVQDWQRSMGEYEADRGRRKGVAQKVQLPPAGQDNKPEHFTRQGEEDDDNTVAAMTRMGEKSVTTIFVQKTPDGWILPSSGKTIDLRKSLDLPDIRALLEHSTRISKKGLVDTLLKQSVPENWTSALLRHCRLVEVNAQGRVEVGKWVMSLDARRGVVIEDS